MAADWLVPRRRNCTGSVLPPGMKMKSHSDGLTQVGSKYIENPTLTLEVGQPALEAPEGFERTRKKHTIVAASKRGPP
jgi:hypothetical protein